MNFKDYLKKLNYYEISKHLAIGVDVLFIFFLLFNYLNYLPEFWITNMTYVFFFVIAINTIFLAFKINKVPEAVRDKSSMIYYFSHFFLLSLVIIVLNQFLKRQFIIDFMPEITIISIALGFLTFYAYRNKVEKEIEDEKIDEEKKEKKRFDEFDNKFPKLNKIPVLRRFVRWMYKEGWWYSVGLILILMYGSFLIFNGLGIQDFYHDESWHIKTVESLNNGEGFKLWDFILKSPTKPYTEGMLTSGLAYFSSNVLGYSTFSLRLFPAIFGLLNIFLIYFIFKNIIGKFPALLSSLGFTLNIIALYLARFLRPYTIFLFFYLLSFYFLYRLLEEFLKEKNLSYKRIGFFAILLLFGVIFTIEERQLGKLLLGIIPLSFLVIFLLRKKVILEISGKNKKFYFFGVLFLILILFLVNYLKIVNLSILLKQARQFISLDVFYSPTIEYYTYLFEKYIKIPLIFCLSYIFGLLFLFYKGFINKETKSVLLFIFSIVPLFIMIYLSVANEDPRYIYFIIPFIYSISMYGLFHLIKNYTKSNRKLLFASILILILFLYYPLLPITNSNQFALKSPAVWEDQDIKTYWHARGVAPEYSKVYTYLNQIQKEGDVVILGDGEYYLHSIEGISYYLIDTWSYSNILESPKQNKTMVFFDLIKKSSNKKIYFVGAYMHMLDPELNNYLLSNCHNLAKDLEIKKYNYNGYYKDRFYWPNLFVCEV